MHAYENQATPKASLAIYMLHGFVREVCLKHSTVTNHFWRNAFLVSIIQPFEYYQNLIIDILGLWKSHRLVFVLQCITCKAHVLFKHAHPISDTSPFSEPQVSVFCLLAVIPLCVLLLSSGIHYPFVQCKFR